MIVPGSSAPLKFRRIGRAETGILSRIPLDPLATTRFIGSLDAVEDVVRRGSAHVLVVAEQEGRPVAFYVTHPDPEDGSSWWLGFLAVSTRVQGGGIGRALLARALRGLSSVPGCRRVLLLVDRENEGARRLYGRMGFRPSGEEDRGTEQVLACVVGRTLRAVRPDRRTRTPFMKRRRFRIRLNPGPHAARVIGLTRGPPGRPATATRRLASPIAGSAAG